VDWNAQIETKTDGGRVAPHLDSQLL